MDKHSKVSIAVFFILSVLTCITFKDTFVSIMFLGMVAVTLVSIFVSVKKKQPLSFEVIYISWFVVCNLFTLGFKYIYNMNIFASMKDKIVLSILMGLPSLFLLYTAKSAARARGMQK